jgi:V8-like Glu-specific endopeptidase
MTSVSDRFAGFRFQWYQPMFMTLWIILGATVPVLTYDCSVGCDLNIAVNGIEVCGVDDITYQNICLLVCQGIDIQRAGNCDINLPLYNATAFEIDTTTFVSIETIHRFKDQGYKLVRKLNKSSYVRRLSRKEPFLALGTNVTDIEDYQAVRLTHDNYEYVTDRINTTAPVDESKTYEPFNPTIRTNRNLVIIGNDYRTRVVPTDVFKNSTVVSVNYPNNRVAYCSGTVINEDAVVMAGHCVFNTRQGRWSGHSDVIPGLNGTFGNRIFDEPFGRWNVSYITTYTQWKNRGNINYDLAVVRYFPNENNETIGSVVGYAGVASIRNVNSDRNLQQSSITGYPGDRRYRMYNTGVCRSGIFTRTFGGSYRIFYTCDTVGGNSGSGITAPDIKVRGVHTHGGSTANSGVGFFTNSPHYRNVLVWSGLLVEPPNLVSCPCAWWRILCRFLHRRQCKRKHRS